MPTTTTTTRRGLPGYLILVLMIGSFNCGVALTKAQAPEPKVTTITCTTTTTDEGVTISAKRCERS